MHPLAGFYINLDRSPGRAAFMQAQLAGLGLAWVRRHAAVDGAHLTPPAGSPLLPGEIACFHSHLQVLESAPDRALTLVLEDDAQLSPQLPAILDQVVRGSLPSFDIALLECQPHYSLAHVSALWDAACRHIAGASRRVGGVDFMDATLYYKWGTTAYLVTPRGRIRLLELLRAWLAEGPLLPVDRCLERAFGTRALQGVITVPFLATTALQWHGHSTIGNGARVPPDALMVLRRLLYAGELGELDVLLRSFAQTPADPALQMFGLVLRQLAADQRLLAQAGAAGPGRPPPCVG